MRHTTRLAAAGAATSLLLAGCTSGPDPADDPAALLDAAIADVADWDGMTATVRLDFDPDQLADAAEATGDTYTDTDRKTADILAGSSLTFAGHPGDDADDTDDDVFTATVTVDGTDAFDLHVVDERFFVRAPVSELVATYADEEAQAEYDAELPQLTDQLAQVGVERVDEIVDGAWVELEGLRQLLSMAEGMAGSSPTADIDPQQLTDLARQGLADLHDTADVTYVGDDGPGHHLQATATGQQVIDAFEPLLVEYLSATAGQLGGMGEDVDPSDLLAQLEDDPDYQEFADTTIPVDVWVDGGTLTQIGIDLVAFVAANPDMVTEADAAEFEALDRFAVLIEVGEFDQTVDVPDDPIVVDLFALAGAAMGGSLVPDDMMEQSQVEASAKSDLRNMGTVQETVYTERGEYTSDVNDLTADGFTPTPGLTHGATAYDGGQAYVVCAATPDGTTVYLDGATWDISEVEPYAGCEPDVTIDIGQGTTLGGDTDEVMQVGGADATVYATDFLTFEPSEATVPAGGALGVKADQGVHHAIVIDAPGQEPTTVASGSAELIDVDVDPGTYTFYCTVPGHRAAGMEGTLTVS